MASGTRSSKRKSSPSLKRKRRIKDRSKKRSKIDKAKSKKVSRRESPDSYSDNESLSSASSVSYSSTDSDSRRSRSRTRKDTSKRRKKSRISRLRSKSIENTINERKGKRSKKSKDTDLKKKSLRKKRRREPSTSFSGRSVSCSTCGSSEHERTEKGVKRRGRSRRDLDENRSWRGHRSRSRSRSCSRLDAGGDDGYLIEEQRPVEHNPRRLRSIIIFAKQFEEEDTEVLDRDVHKEEIVYEKDDYPSTRSNDINDGGDTRRVASKSNGQTGALDDQHDEMVGTEVGIPELSEKCDLGVLEREGHEPIVSSANDDSNEADLEAVLRQKALENLKKFKGKGRANAKKPVSAKSSYDGEVKQSPGINADSELQKKDQDANVLSVPHQNMSTMQESSALNSSAAESLQIIPQDSKTVNPSEEGNADEGRLEGAKIEAKVLNEGNLGADKFAEKAVPTLEKPVLNMPTAKGLPLADSVDDIKDKQETEESILIQCHGSNKVDSQMIPIQESSIPMAVPTQSKDAAESMQLSHDTKVVTDVDKTTTGISTSLASNMEGQSSNGKGNEDGDSQFQQKTMTVMRGGELVQVSYKVYIPKHAPALTRRKLKR